MKTLGFTALNTLKGKSSGTGGTPPVVDTSREFMTIVGYINSTGTRQYQVDITFRNENGA